MKSFLTKLAASALIAAAPAEAPKRVERDIEPLKFKLQSLMEQDGLFNPPELKQRPKQQENSVIEFSSEFSKEDFESIPNGTLSTAEHPPEDTATMQLFLLESGQLKAEMPHHLHENGMMTEMMNARKQSAAEYAGRELQNPAIRKSGSGAFIVITESGESVVLSLASTIIPSKEPDNAKGFLPGLNIAAVKGKDVERCDNDPLPLRPLSVPEMTNDELVGQECEINGFGAEIYSAKGKVFPMTVKGTQGGKVVAEHKVLIMKIDGSAIDTPANLLGFHGAPVRLCDKPHECVGMCTALWKNKNEDGSDTWLLFLVGPDEIRDLSRVVAELPESEDEEGPAPDDEPGKGHDKSDY